MTKRRTAGALQPLAVQVMPPQASVSASRFTSCPACGRTIPIATINFHLDTDCEAFVVGGSKPAAGHPEPELVLGNEDLTKNELDASGLGSKNYQMNPVGADNSKTERIIQKPASATCSTVAERGKRNPLQLRNEHGSQPHSAAAERKDCVEAPTAALAAAAAPGTRDSRAQHSSMPGSDQVRKFCPKHNPASKHAWCFIVFCLLCLKIYQSAENVA